MENSKNIFTKSSVDTFRKRLVQWYNLPNKKRNDDILYLGSFVYDLIGTPYELKAEDNKPWSGIWNDEDLETYWNSTEKKLQEKNAYFITNIIQKEYLKNYNKILHLYIDDSNNKKIDFFSVEELRPINEANIVADKVSDDDKEKINISFDLHFELIATNNLHIYFFPTVLYFQQSIKVINVTTIILKNELNIDDIISLYGGLSFCSEKLISDTIAYYSKKKMIEAIKSAVAAIITRNLSHDLGSHFLTNTKNYFRNTVDKISQDKISQNLLKIIAADYRGNVHVLQYIQERMDFIATIVSTDQYPLSGLIFKTEFFDILTNDDCGARHSNARQDKNEKNFLLQYSLYSEHLTRQSCFEGDNSNFPLVELQTRYNNQIYTGKNVRKENELDLKNVLSELRLAVPGGVMARHALFTLVENILRNAAKHSEHKGNLVLTIKLEEIEGKYKLFFYDNCKSANTKEETGSDTVLKIIEKKLNNITIVDEDGKLNKNDKGLKEMLFCAIWLQNKDLSETLFDIQDKKQSAFQYINVIKVDDNGKELIDDEKEGHLCYTIDLEKWEKEVNLDTFSVKDESGNDRNILTIKEEKEQGNTVCEARIKRDDLLKIHADFVVAEGDYIIKLVEDSDAKNMGRHLSKIFPRFMIGSEIKKNKKELLDKYNIIIEFPDQSLYTQKIHNVFDRNGEDERWKESENNILFFDHLMNANQIDRWDSDDFKNAVYVDSISGENFTSTLIQEKMLMDDDFRYKVIQSAITRIAIIDERIWGNYHTLKQTAITDTEQWPKFEAIFKKDKQYSTLVTEVKNLYISLGFSWEDFLLSIPDNFVNFNEEKKKKFLKEKILQKLTTSKELRKIELLEKRNIFVYTIKDGNIVDIDENVVKEVNCDFVSIHLGLLDKKNGQKSLFDKNEIEDRLKLKQEIFMGFPFVSIHSGRGNFSPNLEKELRDYPFITLSALESNLNNSKYLLSEFLYNTNYYGKGNFNNK